MFFFQRTEANMNGHECTPETDEIRFRCTLKMDRNMKTHWINSKYMQNNSVQPEFVH